MKTITRKEALENKLIKYYTGVPCKHGHVAERSTSTGTCVECRRVWQQSKQGQNYMKEYRAAYTTTEKGKSIGRKATSAHRERRRQWLFDYKKTLSCVYCGETNPLCLDLDHEDPTNKTGTPATMVTNGTNWSIVLEEVQKCQPVCRNCHNIKSIIESGKLRNQDIEQYVPDSMKHLMSPLYCQTQSNEDDH